MTKPINKVVQFNLKEHSQLDKMIYWDKSQPHDGARGKVGAVGFMVSAQQVDLPPDT